MPTASSSIPEANNEHRLVEQIRNSRDSEHVVETLLSTDEQVIARITDGIYRQPGSALRELVSNAYDADATRVVIMTDAPRFQRISIEDNGHGMTPEDLAHLLLHIGGSAKRSDEGHALGITAPSDPFRSPGGRRLIGKIGIGLFSVAQLTHSFQIITKVKGDSFRTIATVALKQYEDQAGASAHDGTRKFESGKVNIWREKAADVPAHGTTIVLTKIRPQARDTLRSREIWSAIEQFEATPDADGGESIEPPHFHIGRVDSSGELLKKTAGKHAALPWEGSDAPDEAFRKLVQVVWDEVAQANPNPQLDRIFDYYLKMAWQLSLAVPLPYVEGHLFDMPLAAWAEAFELSNDPKGTARRLNLPKSRPIRRELKLSDPVDPVDKFEVFFDELKLLRPIKWQCPIRCWNRVAAV